MMQPKVLENLTLFLYLESQFPETFGKKLKGIENAVVSHPQVAIWRWLKDKGHELSFLKLLETASPHFVRNLRASHEQEEYSIDFDSFLDVFARNIIECFDFFRGECLMQFSSRWFSYSAAWATPHQAAYIFNLPGSDIPPSTNPWALWAEIFLKRVDYIDHRDMTFLLGKLPTRQLLRQSLQNAAFLKNSVEILDMLATHFGEEHLKEALTPSEVEDLYAALLSPFEFEENVLNPPSFFSHPNSLAVNIGQLQHPDSMIFSRHRMRPQYRNVLRVIEWMSKKGIKLTKGQLEVFRGVRHSLFKEGLEKLLQADNSSSCTVI